MTIPERQFYLIELHSTYLNLNVAEVYITDIYDAEAILRAKKFASLYARSYKTHVVVEVKRTTRRIYDDDIEASKQFFHIEYALLERC